MRVLISGGSRGIGSACVRRFADAGWDVTFLYLHSAEQADRLATETGALAIRADVADPAAVREAVPAAQDALICCAGIASYGLFQDLRDEDWNRLFAVNVGGVRNCVNAVCPGMLRAGHGSIVTVSSIWGLVGGACEAAYSAAKGAVQSLSLALAKEFGPSGIRVNCIAPGVIETDMLARFSRADLDDLKEQTPLGRIGTPEEVADAAFFLCSEQSAFITGQILSVGGGFGL